MSEDAGRWRRRLRTWALLGLRLLAVFVVASVLVFAAVESMPEDPVSLRVKNPDPARIAEIRASLGLDDPWPVRLGRHMTDFLSGNWGESLISGRSVRAEIATYFPATLELGVLALLLGTSVGMLLVLGSEATGWRGLQHGASALGALGLTVPIYWIGLVLVVVFAVFLGWLPVSGRYDFTLGQPQGTGFYLLDTALRGDGAGFVAACRHLVLPVVTLACYPAALVAGVLRGRLADPRLQKLVIALRAKGLGPLRIWGWHVPRLLAPALITVLGTHVGGLLGGAVLTETVFSWPGMGRFIVDGVLNRDLFVISHGLLLIILLAFVATTLADRLAALANPLTRLDAGKGAQS